MKYVFESGATKFNYCNKIIVISPFKSFIILSGDIPIIWTKEDEAKTIIAMGEMVLAAGYRDRATVSVDNRGSVLSIGIAKSEDAGQYRCEVAVQGSDRPQLKHTVRIRGKK